MSIEKTREFKRKFVYLKENVINHLIYDFQTFRDKAKGV